MSILIIALPRTGSTELGKRLSFTNKLNYEFEPFNPKEELLKYESKNYKKALIKTMVFHTPIFINEEDRLSWLLNISKDFQKIILLSRRDLIAVTESWSFLLYETKNGFKSDDAYVWKKTSNYDEQFEFIKKSQKELEYLSKELNIPITYYEDIYDPADGNRLRKGNREDFNKKLL
jgi:hypothetical protein